MSVNIRVLKLLLILPFLCCVANQAFGQKKPVFKIVAFYTAKHDAAHISFVQEANRWFPQMAARYNFSYDSTNDWKNLNLQFLSNYHVIVFLDSRPDSRVHRIAFENFMKNGGAWLGFHFSGFALTPSTYPQDWDWYHEYFLGTGSYKSNTWRPTAATLKIENKQHPVTKNLPPTFRSSPNEWYRWSNDLRSNPNISILLSIDSSSFPLGTGPKPHEIWHDGYYPVAWTNTKYRMVYMNMGHNDIDYGHSTNKELSHTFGNPVQDQLIINTLIWLGNAGRSKAKAGRKYRTKPVKKKTASVTETVGAW
jgi:hypothetical protein